MEELVEELVSKTGLDRGTALKVVMVIKENAHLLPDLLESDSAKGALGRISEHLGGLLGGPRRALRE
jgi:hypothetical protein